MTSKDVGARLAAPRLPFGSADFVLFEVCGFYSGTGRQAAEFPETGNSALQGRKSCSLWQALDAGHSERSEESPYSFHRNIGILRSLRSLRMTVSLGCGRKAALRYPFRAVLKAADREAACATPLKPDAEHLIPDTGREVTR